MKSLTQQWSIFLGHTFSKPLALLFVYICLGRDSIVVSTLCCEYTFLVQSVYCISFGPWLNFYCAIILMAMSEMGDFNVFPLGPASFANLFGWCGCEVQAGQPHCFFGNIFFSFDTYFPPEPKFTMTFLFIFPSTLFIYLWLSWVFIAVSRGYSLVAEHSVWSAASVVLRHGLSCPTACGI